MITRHKMLKDSILTIFTDDDIKIFEMDFEDCSSVKEILEKAKKDPLYERYNSSEIESLIKISNISFKINNGISFKYSDKYSKIDIINRVINIIRNDKDLKKYFSDSDINNKIELYKSYDYKYSLNTYGKRIGLTNDQIVIVTNLIAECVKNNAFGLNDEIKKHRIDLITKRRSYSRYKEHKRLILNSSPTRLENVYKNIVEKIKNNNWDVTIFSLMDYMIIVYPNSRTINIQNNIRKYKLESEFKNESISLRPVIEIIDFIDSKSFDFFENMSLDEMLSLFNEKFKDTLNHDVGLFTLYYHFFKSTHSGLCCKILPDYNHNYEIYKKIK